MAGAAPPRMTLADWAALALVAEGGAHGWAVVRAMAPAGEVGRIWSCSRARVYRALGTLTEAGWIAETGVARVEMRPERRLLAVTGPGRAAIDAWLATPAPHVRDLRSDLMVKLLFLHRAGRDAAPLLAAQRAGIEPMVPMFEGRLAEAGGFDRTLTAWRLEACRSAIRFIDSVPTGPGARSS